MNVAADSPETINNFVRENIRNLEGADSVMFYPVVKAKRFAPLEKIIEEQQKRLAKRAEGIPESEIDKDFDWVENFEQHAMLTGAFRRDI